MGRRDTAIKQGWFGRTRQKTEWFCDKCGVVMDNNLVLTHTLGDVERQYCRACAEVVAPDITHMWPSAEPFSPSPYNSFFHDKTDGKERCIEQCNRCLSLLVVTKAVGGFERRYYRLGDRQARKEPFPCKEHSGYTEEGEVRSQVTCTHDFIILGSSKDLSPAAHEKHRHMMSHRNKMVESMYGTDEVDIQYACFGSTHFWCPKCGLYRKLNPQREHLLERRGTGSVASKLKEIAEMGGKIETISYPNGSKYIGEVRNGKKHGMGTVTHADGKEWLSGTWEDGKFMG